MTGKGSKTPIVAGICAIALSATTLIVHAQQPTAPQAPAGGPGRGAAPARAGGPAGGRGGPQNQVARVEDVMGMMVALPDKAPAEPKQPRRVLVLGKAQGFVHSAIPLAARTIEALGNKTGAWNTVITYNVADVNAANLQGYDAIVLDSTTGTFLDDPNDAPGTAARRKALMDFVRGGKGLVALHAGTDSYHSLGNGGDPLWPEFNQMINGYFKWHWSYPTQIVMKVEDVNSPINASFTRAGRGGGPRAAAGADVLSIVDEVYTYAMGSWNRSKAHVLTSIDYAKMPAEVKAQEPADGKRTDGDYVLSYIQREGTGRVFVELLGHHESIYKQRPMLEHILAGMQYAIGDLQADDSPASK
jgi:type 1 glutamine amidotransferase